jgi:hypothetical protein
MDKQKYQYNGIKWLMELELLNSPQAINQLKMNILVVSKKIKEVELLIYRENKTMLVLLDLTWMGRKFSKGRIFAEVQDVLSQLLPSFRIRVIDDPKIMQLAVDLVNKALTGGKNENFNNNASNSSIESNSSDESVRDATVEVSSGSDVSSESSKEESSETGQPVRNDVGEDNSKKES